MSVMAIFRHLRAESVI
jgi:hypothetical protein